jgi:Zn finger protein HypA/HybF involved in hydrogenase expression
MGHQLSAKCLDCNQTFKLDRGGGFFFHLVRCDKCGRTKAIGFDKLGKLHLRYLKGLPGPYCVATAEHDENVRKNVQVKPISQEVYHKGIEAIAGKCGCSGKYTLDAPARCPKCRSTRIEEGPITLVYD